MSIQSESIHRKVMDCFDERIPDRSTRQILSHAIDVFARKGLAATRIQDIAASAGFSQGYVYNYFKSKDELFIRIVDLAADGAAVMVRSASELPGTPYQRLYWLTEALLSSESAAMRHWRLIMLQAATSEAVPGEARRIAGEKMIVPVALLIPVLIEGQRLGEFTPEDPAVLALTYFSFVQGLGITRVQGGADIPFPTVEMVLRFITHQK